MNLEYLNTLPDIGNKFNVDLQEDEKVVFAAKLTMFGTETDKLLGTEFPFTMTNKRIIVEKKPTTWTIDIADDIAKFVKVESGVFIFKSVYFSVALNDEIAFDDGKQKLNGFNFYFKKADTAKLETIINNLF